MKTKYLIVLAVPYVAAYLLLFISAFKQTNCLEEKGSINSLAAQYKNQIQYPSDSLFVAKDTFAVMNKRQY